MRVLPKHSAGAYRKCLLFSLLMNTSEIVDGLRRRNIEVRTLNELNLLSMPDEKILAYATSHSFVVYTRDSDFLRLHTDGFKHNGIIITIL